MSIETILTDVSTYPCSLVEITGGEPLLQTESIELMKALHNNGYDVLLETNGAVALVDVPEYVVKIVDVKCPGSGHGNSFLIQNLALLGTQDELKFVLTDERDYHFAQEFIREHHLESRRLLFSPVTQSLTANELAEWMLRDGSTAHLQLQLHKLLRID